MVKAIGLAACAALTLAGCAEQHLGEAATAATRATGAITVESNLKAQAAHARALSKAYVDAAGKSKSVQDLSAGLIYVSAASVVAGAAGSASNSVLAKRATVGATGDLIGKRAAPKTTIGTIYTGAMRLNCIATVAELGTGLLGGLSDRGYTVKAARALTYGAISEVEIATLNGVTRDAESFSSVLGTISDAAKDATAMTQAFRTSGDKGADATIDVPTINKYASLLSNCLGAKKGSQEGTQITQ